MVSLKYTSRDGICPSMHVCVCVLTLSNMIISTTSRPIPTKFYPKHHWGGGNAALGFWPDRTVTLVSMATDSSHRVIMGKISLPSSVFIFDRIFFILAGKEDNYNIPDEFEFQPDSTKNCGVSCP